MSHERQSKEKNKKVPKKKKIRGKLIEIEHVNRGLIPQLSSYADIISM